MARTALRVLRTLGSCPQFPGPRSTQGFSLDGPLACERIVDGLEEMMEGRAELPRPNLGYRLRGRFKTNIRNLVKRLKARLPGSHNRPEFH